MSVILEEGRARGAAITAKEIAGQAEHMAQTIEVVREHREEIDALLHRAMQHSNLHVIFTGAGSSGFIGEILFPILRRELGMDMQAIHTTDIVASPKGFLSDVPTLLVSFARSGDSPESVAALKNAAAQIKTLYQLIVVCNQNSALSRYGEETENAVTLHIPQACCDEGFAMTSSVTNMLCATYLAFHLTDFDTVSSKLQHTADQMLQDLPRLSQTARKLAQMDYDRLVVLGSGALKGLAKECAMKSLELSRGTVNATADGATGFRHGPKCVISQHTLTVHLISSYLPEADYDADLLREICMQRDGNRTVAITCDKALADIADVSVLFDLDERNDLLLALRILPLMQLLALNKSIQLGLTPDNPYADNGKVNRVVQGVILHEDK